MKMAHNRLMNILPRSFCIPSSQLHLLNSIGHGTKTVEGVISLYRSIYVYMPIPAGEFGEVYKLT